MAYRFMCTIDAPFAPLHWSLVVLVIAVKISAAITNMFRSMSDVSADIEHVQRKDFSEKKMTLEKMTVLKFFFVFGQS